MKDKLSFLEKELGIQMQYKLLDQVEVIENKLSIKTCYSKLHRTRHVCCYSPYKKIF